MNLAKNKKIDLKLPILIAISVFILFIYLGMLLPPDISGDSLSQIKDMLKQLQGIGSIPLLLIIFINNTLKCLVALLSGILLGLPPLIYIGINASLIGVLVANSQGIGFPVLIAGLAPHGVIEIPALIFSAALGISIGHEAYKFITRQASAVRLHLTYALNLYYKWIVVLLLVAALIEVFVTPQVIATTGGNIAPVIIP